MDLIKKYAPIANKRSIRQYDQPRCYELAGKKLTFAIDTGEETGEIVLDVADKQHLKWSICGGKAAGEADYECRKSDDDTYLLTYCVPEPRENHTFVIDMEQELVTFLRCIVGENAYYPLLVDSHFGFGYIVIEGKEHMDYRRHGFTEDVSGTAVRWTYGHELSTIHAYFDPHWYRIAYPREGLKSKSQKATNSLFRECLAMLPGSEEPAYYVKIKEGMYLVSVTEQNMEKIVAEKFGFRSDTLCFLDNWNRMTSVGRGYGTRTDKDGNNSELFLMIGKYGSPVDVDPKYMEDPIAYIV